MQLICYGDSITFGYGVRRSARWTSIASERMGIEICNRGISGDTSSGMLARLRSELLDKKEQIAYRPTVFLMGGTNDIFYSGSDICARVNMGAMIHELMAAGISPLIGIPMGIGSDWFPDEWSSVVDFPSASLILNGYSDWLSDFSAVFHLKTVDFRPFFCDETGEKRKNLFLDGLHPNEEGHRLMAEALIQVLGRSGI